MDDFVEIDEEVARKGEKMENQAIKEAAKLLVKRAWIAEDLYAPIVYWSTDNLLHEAEKTSGDSHVILDLEARYECGRKTFSPYNTWRVKLQHCPVIRRTLIWLSVNSEDCKEEILLSARGIQPYWERMLDILMKFEGSWHEKAQFILDSLETFNQRAKSANPVLAKILDQISEKIMAQYDETEKKTEKFGTEVTELKSKNNDLRRGMRRSIEGLKKSTKALENTKAFLGKSKTIKRIREDIEYIISYLEQTSSVND